MAIYYVPGEAGWNDNGMFGSAAQLRLKLETSYDNALNRSTVTVALQARLPSGSGDYLMTSGSSVALNGVTVGSGGGSHVSFGGTTNWRSLADSMSGSPVLWTATVDHAADGSASVTLSVHVQLYQDSSHYLNCLNRSAAQAIDETRQFTLSLSAGTGCGIAVMRGGLALADGDTLSYGDTLTVSFTAQSGYVLLTHTVNGADFTSGGSLTVTGAVAAAATARRMGLVRIDTGSALQSCRVLLDTGSALLPVRLFLDSGTAITEVGS